jgi:hypothetical protein
MKRSFLFFGFALAGILAGSISAIAQVNGRGNPESAEKKERMEVSKATEAKQVKKSPVEAESRTTGQKQVAPAPAVNSNKEAQTTTPVQKPVGRQEPAATSGRNNTTPAATKTTK